ncbi:MAG: NINE protein [Cyanobacteria bacterium HKST-UBA02]|nr:NINE protein [Cyanobacteria bacterium HKST-UBA02]
MIQCPVCSTNLEFWQIECHDCGQFISSNAIPIVEAVPIEEGDLEQAFATWMKRGRKAFKLKSFDEAHACYGEALKRVKGVAGLETSEVKARQCLADAYEKLGQKEEAIENLIGVESLLADEKAREKIRKRIDRLNRGELEVEPESRFVPCEKEDRQSAKLYCSSCFRLLSEAEVYPFRQGKSSRSRCACGNEGSPMVMVGRELDVEGLLESGMRRNPRKDRLIEAAQKPVQGGRTRNTAFWLALLLGLFGAHKFYLGEKARGYAYLALCWTLIPWAVAVYEAILIAQMSRVSFNLVYNIERVLARMPDEESLPPDQEDAAVLSMIVSEDDPEDLIDEWSVEDEV